MMIMIMITIIILVVVTIINNRDHNTHLLYIHVSRAQMTSILEGQPLKTRPFPTKTRVIWVLGIYIYTVHIFWYAYIKTFVYVC